MIKKAVSDRCVDILIIGGGLMGLTLLLALKDQGFDVLLVDATLKTSAVDLCQKSDVSKRAIDARTLALSPSSIAILQQLQIWPALREKACTIQRIHVSQQGHFGVTELHAKAQEDLGATLELPILTDALYQALSPEQVLAPTEFISLDPIQKIATVKHEGAEFKIAASLFVAADGGLSTVRTSLNLPAKIKSYNQTGLVANIVLQRQHHHCAYERFTASGPLAMLPMQGLQMAMVWCLKPEEGQALQTMEEALFLQRLQKAFGYRLGRFLQVGQRVLFPLQEIIMPTQSQEPVVFIGNAAHTLHPVAGQGFNLGLRDVAALAQCIVAHGLKESMLEHYQAMRQADQVATIRWTDGLIRLFASQMPGLAWARGMGLLMLDNLSFLQQWGARYARGYGGDRVPDLVCGIALEKHQKICASKARIVGGELVKR